MIPANLVLAVEGVSPRDGRVRPAGQAVHPRRGHRPDPRRRAASSWCWRTTAARPSGVSYVLENRVVMKKVFPQLFQQCRVRRVEDYPQRLREALSSVAPAGAERPAHASCCCRPGRTTRPTSSTASWPGTWASSWCFGQDLFVARRPGLPARPRAGPSGWTSSIAGSTTTSSIPETFRPDSLLGVPGLMQAYRAGNVTLANAVGTGVADDKAIYPFVEDMIRFYLSARSRSCGTCRRTSAPRRTTWRYVLDHLAELVVKAVNESGGYGMLMGPSATSQQRAEFADKLAAQPAQLHRPAGGHAVHLPDLDRRGPGAAARRSAAVHRQRQRRPGCCPAA